MSEQDNGRKRDNQQAAEYALGVLPAEERVAFESRLANEPELRALLVQWESDLLPMAESYSPVDPPEGTYRLIEERLFGTGEQETSDGLFNRIGFWRGLAAASIAGMMIFAGLFMATRFADPIEAPRLVAQIVSESDDLQVIAFHDPDENVLRLNRAEGQAAEGRDLELWLIADNAAPVSLGVLPRDRQANLPLSEAHASVLPQAVLAISDEPEGGSPTGLPTGAVLATGMVNEI